MVLKVVQEVIQEWFEAMPEGMRDIPMVAIYVEEVARVLTPRQVYEEVMAETELGREIEKAIIKLALELLLRKR